MKQIAKEVSWDFVISLMMLGYLLRMRDWLTPDFFHFVMCVGEDACHAIWTFVLWLSFKGFYMRAPAQQHTPENTYIIVTLVEGILGLTIAGELRTLNCLIFFGLSSILILRLKYPQHLTATLFFFIAIYLSQNFVVNSLDWVIFKRKAAVGYYHDEEFLRSFSYKVY